MLGVPSFPLVIITLYIYTRYGHVSLSGGRTCRITRGSFFSVLFDETSFRSSTSSPGSDVNALVEGAGDILVTLVLVRSAVCFPAAPDTLRPPFLPPRAASGSAPLARVPCNAGFFRSRRDMDVSGARALRVDDAFAFVSASPPLRTENMLTVRTSQSSMLARADADLRGLTAFSSCGEYVSRYRSKARCHPAL